MNREEHLAWAKERALEYVDRGELHAAFASITSDLAKHPETDGHAGTELGFLQLMTGGLSTPAEMRHWIEGYQ